MLEANDLVRYSQNVCEYGYSFVWWDWSDWEKHIDWMALNGLNLVLAESGQEWIAMKTLMEFGMSRKEVQSHFTGPAFLPWNRMGNLNSWAGPLPMSWIEADRVLQHKILGRLRDLGIIPAVPAFNGIVPKVLLEKYHPYVNFTRLRKWGHFPDKYTSSYLLDVTSNLSLSIARVYLRNYISEYGSDHFYSLDTFNEMSPPVSHSGMMAAASAAAEQEEDELDYLRMYASGFVYDSLRSADSEAIWLMQGWMFRNTSFWKEPQAKALLTALPTGRILALDLASTTSPQYKRFHSYFGQPFVFCMLHDYGGTLGFYGKVETVNQETFDSRNYSSMVGLGLTPEGIHNSYAMYDLMLEMTWRPEPISNLENWFTSYARRRYGMENEHLGRAWNYVASSAYNCCTNHIISSSSSPQNNDGYFFSSSSYSTREFRFHGKTALTQLPSLHLHRNLWYDEQTFLLAWDEIISAFEPVKEQKQQQHEALLPVEIAAAAAAPALKLLRKTGEGEIGAKLRQLARVDDDPESNGNLRLQLLLPTPETCEFDVIDFSRQALVNSLYPMYKRTMLAYYHNDTHLFAEASREFLALAADIDKLLSASKHFLLGHWLRAAKTKGRSRSNNKNNNSINNNNKVEEGRASNVSTVASWRISGSSSYDELLYEFNARNQITLWGPQGNILDYAAKQWSGLVSSYYLPRWMIFFKLLRRNMRLKKQSGQRRRVRSDSELEKRFRRIFMQRVGIPFTVGREVYPAQPAKGSDPFSIAIHLHKKWRKIIHERIILLGT